MEVIRRNPLTSFFILTFVISWGCFTPLIFLGQGMSPALVTVVIMAGGFGPLLSALFVGLATKGAAGVKELRDRLFTLRVGIRWYLFALLFPLALVAAGNVLFVLAGGERLDFAATPPLYLYVPSLIFVFFLGGGQEEPGWRGFALPRMQAKLTALWSSVVLGLVWALWHLPLFFVTYSAQNALPFAWYVPHTVAMAIIFTWLFNNARGSVFLAMLLHGGVNAAAGWMPLTAAAGWLPPLGSVTLIECALALLLIVRYGAQNLSHTPRIVVHDSAG